ncbi:MAG: hypothetical protein AAB671_00440 [Patescibacteria group bacterium]
MKSAQSTTIATEVLRQSGAPGSLAVFELSHERAADLKLVLLAEIEVSDKDNDIIIEDIVREIEHQFFNSPAAEVEYAFENALAKANIRVKDTLLGKPKNWLNRIHIAVVALAGDEVHLGSVGTVHAFLVRREKIVDVLKAPGGPAAPNPVKLFTNIVSGTLGADTSMVLANESVLDYLSIERIRKCAQEFDAPEALAALTELLGRAPSHKQFALAVINRSRERAPEAAIPRREPHSPLAAESATYGPHEEEEEEPFEDAPAGIPRFEAEGRMVLSVAARAREMGREALTLILAGLAKLLETLGRLIVRLIPAIARAAKTAAATFRNPDTRAYVWQRTRQAARALIYGQPRKRQLALAAVVVLVAGFIGSISVRAYRQNQEVGTAEFSDRIAGVEQKVSEAEASLIYGNKIKSQALLAEVQTLLVELEQEFPDQEDQYAAIQSSITALQDKGEKKQSISDIATVATAVPAPISANESGILALGGKIFFYDGVQEKIAGLDVQNSLLLSLPLEEAGIDSFNVALPLAGDQIAALAPGLALIVDTGDETVARQAFPYVPGTSKPFAAYGGNMYTWSTEENQVVRFRRAGAGFTAPQNWLTTEYELATMRSIAVDGFVYLLDSQGTIHVFLRGNLTKTIPWAARELPGDEVRLYTTETGSVLYILDPSYSRIVIESKEGELAAQLTNPLLEGVTDMAVDADEKNIYALAGDKIYRFGIPNY